MSGRCLLDTNILIALFAGDPNVQQELGQASEVLIPIILVISNLNTLAQEADEFASGARFVAAGDAQAMERALDY